MRRTRDRQEGPSDIPALKPYWGKPAVRDFRGSHGNVGIIRSPVRAMALPGIYWSDDCGLNGSWVPTKSQPGTVRLWQSGTEWGLLSTGDKQLRLGLFGHLA